MVTWTYSFRERKCEFNLICNVMVVFAQGFCRFTAAVEMGEEFFVIPDALLQEAVNLITKGFGC